MTADTPAPLTEEEQRDAYDLNVWRSGPDREGNHYSMMDYRIRSQAASEDLAVGAVLRALRAAEAITSDPETEYLLVDKALMEEARGEIYNQYGQNDALVARVDALLHPSADAD
jgi:hypothetical protein